MTESQILDAPAEVRPLTMAVGAEVVGVDLADVSDATAAWIRAAWLEHGVLVFRGQHVTREEHIAFGRLFGDLDVQAYGSVEGHPELLQITSSPDRPVAAVRWHTDVTWKTTPPVASILRGTVIPSAGGDTLFANAALAYERLTDEWRQRIEGLTAVHDRLHAFAHRWTPVEIAEQRDQYPLVRHPVVREHPETGRRLIYTNRTFATRIEGVSPEESEAILDHLERAIMEPGVQCRVRWEVDTIVMWDNRFVQHCVANDFWPAARTVERVTVIGDSTYTGELVATS